MPNTTEILEIAQRAGMAHNGGAGGEHVLCATERQLEAFAEVLARGGGAAKVAAPAVFTEAQIAEGVHVLSEWLNDNAPLGEHRYLDALKGAVEAMLKTPPDQEPRRLF
jgi:hypothetical protein